MTHWKKFMDKEFLFAYDLDGRDVVVTIEKVTGGSITGKDGKSTKKPIATFVGAKKKLALNNTNCTTIAALYGNDVEKWSGKKITLYPTTTTFGRDTVECIRVRPSVPNGARRGAAGAAGETERGTAPPVADAEPTTPAATPEVDDVDAMASRDMEPQP